MARKQKSAVRPNECSLGRWIMVLLLGAVLGTILTVPLVALEQLRPDFLAGTPIAFMSEQFILVASFIPMYLGIFIAIRLIAKMPMRTFIHGERETLAKKTGLVILGLYLLGLAISLLPSITKLRPSGIQPNQFLINLVMALLLVWIQTTYEEIMFRGVFIRYACGNDIRMSRKAVAMGLLSATLFMLAHFSNPEILTQSGAQIAMAALAYFTHAIGMYFADIYFKSLMPGILIHWLNNMVAFVLVCNEVSVGQHLALFVDSSATTGSNALISTILAYVPLFIYIAFKAIQKKKAA